MGIWGDIGKAVASGLLDQMEHAGKEVARNTYDPEKAERALRTAESARRLREEYLED